MSPTEKLYGVTWHPSLLESLFRTIPRADLGNRLLVCYNLPSFNNTTRRLFACFDTPEILYEYIELLPVHQRHLFEVIRGECAQKPHFDLDIVWKGTCDKSRLNQLARLWSCDTVAALKRLVSEFGNDTRSDTGGSESNLTEKVAKLIQLTGWSKEVAVETIAAVTFDPVAFAQLAQDTRDNTILALTKIGIDLRDVRIYSSQSPARPLGLAKTNDTEGISTLVDSLAESVSSTDSTKLPTSELTTPEPVDLTIIPTKKYSYHIVLPTYRCLNAAEAKALWAYVHSTLPPQQANYLDEKVYSSLQQFRLLKSSKSDSDRIKTLEKQWRYRDLTVSGQYPYLERDQFIESLVSYVDVNCGKTLPSFPKVVPVAPVITHSGGPEPSPAVIEAALLLFQYSELLPDHARLDRVIKGNLILLRRTQPSLCPICDRPGEPHYNNNPFLLVREYSAGNWQVVYYCRSQYSDGQGMMLGYIKDEEVLGEGQFDGTEGDSEVVPGLETVASYDIEKVNISVDIMKALGVKSNVKINHKAVKNTALMRDLVTIPQVVIQDDDSDTASQSSRSSRGGSLYSNDSYNIPMRLEPECWYGD